MRKIFLKLILALCVLAFIPLSGLKAQTLLVTGDGADTTHSRIPVYGLYFETKQKSQMIYPASKLTDLQGKKITRLTLFTSQGNNNNWENEVHVRMACTTQDDLDAGWFTGVTTEVFVGLFVINSNNELVIELATPFLYTGDNLLIEYDVPTTTSSAWGSVSFYGTSEASNISRHAYSDGYTGAGTAYGFLPKMQVEYFDETCPAITNFNAIVNPNNTAMLTWNTPDQSIWPAGATNLKFKFFNGTTQIGEIDSNDLRLWTSNALPLGTHNLGITMSYLDNGNNVICETGLSSKTVTTECPPVSDLTATIVNDNDVKLTWEAPKIPTLILSEDFENGWPAGWTVHDADGDGHEWYIDSGLGHFSENFITSLSYDYDSYNYLTPNNYLITPLVEGATHLQYWVRSVESYPYEKYAIMVSTTGNNTSDFTIVHEEILDPYPSWQQRNIDLPEGTKYIAFRHYDCSDQLKLEIDNISVYGNATPIADAHTFTIYRDWSEIASGITDATYTDTGLNGNEYDYCVEVVYESCISYPECKYITVPDVPRPPVNNLVATVNGNDVTLTWGAPSNVLLIEGFESATLPSNWTIRDQDGDGQNWTIDDTWGHNSGQSIYSASYDGGNLNPNNYLITPQVTGATKIEYWVESPNEKYAVMYSTTGNYADNFSTAFEETIPTFGWNKRIVDIPQNTQYIAFRHYESPHSNYRVYVDNVVVYGNQTFAGNYTYTIYRNGEEIASGLTELTYTDSDLNVDMYNYCVEVVYENATSDFTCVDITVHDVARPPVRNLSATASSNNVNLTWDAPVKALLIENFEGATLPAGWTTINNDGDAHNWFLLSTPYSGHLSNNSMISASYDPETYSPLSPDNFLITPLVEGATHLQYWVRSVESYPYEKYAIMVSTTGNNTSDFTIVHEEILDPYPSWQQRNIDLPEGTKYIAFRHYDCSGQWNLYIDDVVVYGNQPVTDEYTYTVNRNGEEIASGIEKTNTTYSDQSLVAGLYDYHVKVVYENAISDPVCTSVEAAGALTMYYDTVGNQLIVAGSPFTAAIRLTNDELATYYNDYKITQVRYYIHNIDATDITIKIYGNGTATEPGGILVEEPAYPTQDGWNIHTLTEPLLITSGDYWVGCSFDSDFGQVTIGIDNGPAIAEKGDWYYTSTTWYELGSANWNIRAALSPVIDVCPQVTNLNATLNLDNTITLDWTNPEQATWPSGATMLTFNFFDGGTQIGNSNSTIDAWTTAELTPGTHSLGVQIAYWENASTNICLAAISYVSIDVPEPPACPQVNNFTASASGNNVNLSWEAPDALQTVLLSESFESGIPSEWTLIDADGDGNKWTADNSYTAHSGNSVATSFSKYFGSALTPDNYLITPLVEGATSVKYYYSVDATSPAEHYAVMASTTGIDVTDFQIVFEETVGSSGWNEGEVELPAGTKYVAFRHYDCTNQSYILLDDITVYGEAISNCTYIISKDGVDIETGYTATAYTDTELAEGTYTYCVKAVFEGCTPDPVCETVTVEEAITCSAVENLTATTNTDNTVELSWDIPASTEWPTDCNGNLGFKFYNGSTLIGQSDVDDLTTWTTNVLPNGTYTLKVVINYYDNADALLCSAEASTTVTISGSFDCPPVENLTATASTSNKFDLTWIIPTELPTNCNGNLDFKFYDGTTEIGSDNTDDLTSWTTPTLSVGTHTLAVVVYYYDDTDAEICFAEANVTVTTDVEEIKASIFSAEIYPNPAKDVLNIVSDSEIISYELYDALGRVLINKSNVSNTESIVNVSSLKHGMYMLRLNTANGSGMFKVIIDN